VSTEDLEKEQRPEPEMASESRLSSGFDQPPPAKPVGAVSSSPLEIGMLLRDDPPSESNIPTSAKTSAPPSALSQHPPPPSAITENAQERNQARMSLGKILGIGAGVILFLVLLTVVLFFR
jgi:hypothetical protein